MLSSLFEWDTKIFNFINQDLSAQNLDFFMILLSSEAFWLILGLLTLIYIFKKYKNIPKKSWITVLLAMTITDITCYRILKPLLERKRPCHQLENVRVVDGCGSEFGLPSNHAANGMSLVISLRLVSKQMWPLKILPLVLFIGYSRVYLGVHYPIDIMMGFLVGSLLSFFTYYMVGLLNKTTITS